MHIELSNEHCMLKMEIYGKMLSPSVGTNNVNPEEHFQYDAPGISISTQRKSKIELGAGLSA
eukprot:4021707-Prorocentrum_lima.AAC.1